MDKIEEVKKILMNSLPAYEEEIGKLNSSPTGDWSGLDRLDGEVAPKICQLFEPKPDESRLLSPEEEYEVELEASNSDEWMKSSLNYRNFANRKILQAQDTKTASIYETLLRAEESLYQMRVERTLNVVRDYFKLNFGEFAAKYSVDKGKLPGDEIWQALKKEIPDKEG